MAAISISIELSLDNVIKNANAAGKNPRIETDCRISLTGIIILETKCFLAAMIPNIIAVTNDNHKAANILQTEDKESIANKIKFTLQFTLDPLVASNWFQLLPLLALSLSFVSALWFWEPFVASPNTFGI
jgi:hypothetical protein